MAMNAAVSSPWYRSLNRSQWNTLFATNLGWLFDGYEVYALILTVGVALHQLLDPTQYARIPVYAGTIIATTLFGWGVGGMIGGILADYIGRKRTMMLAILAYSLTTGLSALAWSWGSFAVLRFIVGVAIGSEWATGASITAELWPDKARGRGAGLMQCGLGIGFFLASLVWVFVSPNGPNAWRYMFVLGVLPGLCTLWIRRGIPESAVWERTHQRRQAATARKKSGAKLSADDHALARFTLVELFADPAVRMRLVIVFLMSLTTTLAWWGISSFVPPYVASVAAKAGLPGPVWAGYTGMAYNLGAILGYIGLGFFADVVGRKPVVLVFYAAALIMTPVLFLWTHNLDLLLVAAGVNGFFTLGQYSWMPVWLPELFPTRVRATAVAFAFNTPRFVAFIGPLIAGTLIANFGGFGNAAVTISLIYILGFVVTLFLPETRGKPLPERI
ncbi:MAG: MFS transporter [Alphaproteobacteria bacterium]|nr:MFS transporter [Alphaproteobacteria bacterium]